MYAVFPLYLEPLTAHLDTVSSCWLPSAEETRMNRSMSSGATKLGLEHMISEEETGRTRFFQLKEEIMGGNLLAILEVRKKTDGS